MSEDPHPNDRRFVELSPDAAGLPSENSSAKKTSDATSSTWLTHANTNDDSPSFDDESTYTVVTSPTEICSFSRETFWKFQDSGVSCLCSIIEWCGRQLEHGVHQDEVDHPSLLIFIADRKAKASKENLWALKTSSGKEVSHIFKERKEKLCDSNEDPTSGLDFPKLVVECMQGSPGANWKKDALDRFAEKTHGAPEELHELLDCKKGCLVMSPSSGKVLGVGMQFQHDPPPALWIEAWRAAKALPKTDKWNLLELSADGLRCYYPLKERGEYRLKAKMLLRKYPAIFALAHAVGAAGVSTERVAVVIMSKMKRFLCKDDRSAAAIASCRHSIQECCDLWQQLVKEEGIDRRFVKGWVVCKRIETFEDCVSEEACDEASRQTLALYVGGKNLVTLACEEERRKLLPDMLGKHPSAASMPWRAQSNPSDGMVTVEPLVDEGNSDLQFPVKLPEAAVDWISHFALVARPPTTVDDDISFTDSCGGNKRMVVLTRKTWTQTLVDCGIDGFKLTVVQDAASSNGDRSEGQ